MISLHAKTRGILERYRIRPQKELSQHFLIDDEAFENIVSTIAKADGQHIFEIGTGLGLLTEALAQHAKEVLTLEVDTQVCNLLNERWSNHNIINLVKMNVLKFDPESYFGNRQYLAVGNLPYHLSGSIIRWFLDHRRHFSEIFLMLQKEVAERIVASAGSKRYGVLTLLCQYFTSPQILFDVPANAFLPPPKVDSAFIRMTPKMTSDDPMFVTLVKQAFRERRKTIFNNLKSWNIHTPTDWEGLLQEVQIEKKSRAEQIPLELFLKLSKSL